LTFFAKGGKQIIAEIGMSYCCCKFNGLRPDGAKMEGGEKEEEVFCGRGARVFGRGRDVTRKI
jgi:hypothetical protein